MAIVTGGSRGIGLAIARALVAEGVQVADHRAERRAPVRGAAADRSGGPGVGRDAARRRPRLRRVERAVAATVARFGGLDILVNNAGVGIFANVADMTPAQWSEVIDTNLTGVFNVCHAAIPHLQRRGGGFIINISSLAGKNAFAGRRRVLRVEVRASTRSARR